MTREDRTPYGIQRALIKVNRRGTILEGASDGLEFRPKTRRLEGGASFPLILFLALRQLEPFPAGGNVRIDHKIDHLLNPLAPPRCSVHTLKPNPDLSVRSEWRWRLDFVRAAGYSDQSATITARE
jgi:hypothetical protein